MSGNAYGTTIQLRKRCYCGKPVPAGRQFNCSKECDEKEWARTYPLEPMPDDIQDFFSTNYTETTA